MSNEIKKGDFDKYLKEWCKITNRSGGVLMGVSLREFFEWLENKLNINKDEKTSQEIKKEEGSG